MAEALDPEVSAGSGLTRVPKDAPGCEVVGAPVVVPGARGPAEREGAPAVVEVPTEESGATVGFELAEHPVRSSRAARRQVGARLPPRARCFTSAQPALGAVSKFRHR